MSNQNCENPVTELNPVDQEPFKTSDLYFCAALMSAGHEFVGIEKKSPEGNNVFILRRDGDIEIDSRKYVLGTLIIRASLYLEKIMTIRQKVYGGYSLC